MEEFLPLDEPQSSPSHSGSSSPRDLKKKRAESEKLFTVAAASLLIAGTLRAEGKITAEFAFHRGEIVDGAFRLDVQRKGLILEVSVSTKHRSMGNVWLQSSEPYQSWDSKFALIWYHEEIVLRLGSRSLPFPAQSASVSCVIEDPNGLFEGEFLGGAVKLALFEAEETQARAEIEKEQLVMVDTRRQAAGYLEQVSSCPLDKVRVLDLRGCSYFPIQAMKRLAHGITTAKKLFCPGPVGLWMTDEERYEMHRETIKVLQKNPDLEVVVLGDLWGTTPCSERAIIFQPGESRIQQQEQHKQLCDQYTAQRQALNTALGQLKELRLLVLPWSWHEKPMILPPQVDVCVVPIPAHIERDTFLLNDAFGHVRDVRLMLRPKQPCPRLENVLNQRGNMRIVYDPNPEVTITAPTVFAGETMNSHQEVLLRKHYDLEQVWARAGRGNQIRVAVIDSGICYPHPMFAPGSVTAYSFIDYEGPGDLNGHGTHVAGIIHQIAPQAHIYSLKALDAFGRGSYEAVNKALAAAIKLKVHIINLSLGFPCGQEEQYRWLLQAQANNIVVVCSAANEGRTHQRGIFFPARYGNVICIGSHGISGERSDFSSVGREIDVLALGEDVVSACPYPLQRGDLFQPRCSKSGTSMASPVVAGFLAILVSHAVPQRLTPYEVRTLIERLCTKLGHHDEENGYGVFNPHQFIIHRGFSREVLLWLLRQ